MEDDVVKESVIRNPEINGWPDVLERAVEEVGSPFRHVRVFAETDSTQDVARRERAEPGTLIVAGRQTRGRGRLGSAWADTASDGVAMTLILPREPGERLAFAAAVGVARAAESCLGRRITIKWPNDILVDRRKLAGILIEQTDTRALLGIGFNVAQTAWPDDLTDKAVSLTQLGVPILRIEVMCELIRALGDSLALDTEALMQDYAERDGLTGRTIRVQHEGRTYEGRVATVNPRDGLLLETERDGTVHLPAMTSRTDLGSGVVRNSAPVD
ncbi:MAG: biotin--[acetyl-CoA-carboxylase] ligase [Phycisphaerales bacterium]|nr:MAG: biotin--[acetyl-CoA-carboxylase] ligase [Phycisphaerales bacterium]